MPISEREYMKDDEPEEPEEETRLVMTGTGFKVTKRPVDTNVGWWWYIITALIIVGLAWLGAR